MKDWNACLDEVANKLKLDYSSNLFPSLEDEQIFYKEAAELYRQDLERRNQELTEHLYESDKELDQLVYANKVISLIPLRESHRMLPGFSEALTQYNSFPLEIKTKRSSLVEQIFIEGAKSMDVKKIAVDFVISYASRYALEFPLDELEDHFDDWQKLEGIKLLNQQP